MTSNTPSGLDRSPTGLDEPIATPHPEAPMQPVQQPPPDAAVPSDNAPPEVDDTADVIPMEADDDDVIDDRYEDEDEEDDGPAHPSVQLAAELLINGADAALAVLAQTPWCEHFRDGPLPGAVERACSEFLEDRFERELASGVPEATIAERLDRMTSLLGRALDATEDEAHAWDEQVAQAAPVGMLRGLRAAVRPVAPEGVTELWFPLARGVEVHGVRLAGVDDTPFDHANVARVLVGSQKGDDRYGESISVWRPDFDDHPMGPYRLREPILSPEGSMLVVQVMFRAPSDAPFEVRPFGRMVTDTPMVNAVERAACAPAVDLVVAIQAQRRMVGLQGLSFGASPHGARPSWIDDICVLEARVDGEPIWVAPTEEGAGPLRVRSVNARDHIAFSLFDALAGTTLDVGGRLTLTVRTPGPVAAEPRDLIVGVSGWADTETGEATTEADEIRSWQQQFQDLYEDYARNVAALDSDAAHRGLTVGSIIRAFQIVPAEVVERGITWNERKLAEELPHDIGLVVRGVVADGNGHKLSRALDGLEDLLARVFSCVQEARSVLGQVVPAAAPALAEHEPEPAP